ncbi:MAG: TRAP transporter substrate-binding protein [Acidiferrobacterales bacterium]|nr:TRAP transporter substrate-binding protein [Acidiferrobacterales bacterium]
MNGARLVPVPEHVIIRKGIHMKFKLITGAVACILAVFASVALAEKWDMPLAYSATNYQSENAAAFAAAVEEATDGKLKIVTHPDGSLYKGGEIYAAVKSGQVPIGERLMSTLGNEHPIFEIDALPFLATSFEDAWKLQEATAPILAEVLRESGLVLLYTVPWPPQGLYTVKPVQSAADMKDVKFRAYNDSTVRLAELMGAVPQKLEVAELFQAFATGATESMISSASTGYDRKLWEHISYWYDLQAWLPKNMVIVNQDAWDSLDADTQAVVRKAAADAQAAGWGKVQELAAWYKEQLTANGMEVHPPDDQLRAELETIGQVMTQEWLEKAGETGQAAIDAYEAM